MEIDREKAAGSTRPVAQCVLGGLFLLCVLISGAARADSSDDEYTASEVSSWCQPYKTALIKSGVATVQQSPMSQFCFGAFFTIAAMTSLSASGTEDGPPALGICPPNNARTSDLIKIFMHYVDEHPEQETEFYLSIAVTALRNAYPCRSGAQKP